MKATFLQPFSRKGKSPFVREVLRWWPDATFEFGALPPLNYRSRAWLYFVGWPTLAWFAFRAGWRIFGSDAAEHDVVVCTTDAELIGLALARFAYRRRTPIILTGFILTSRASSLLESIRAAYFRRLLGQAKAVICHSAFEAERYRAILKIRGTAFASVPYGLHVWEPASAEAAAGSGYIVSAGRSGRDYALLSKAVASLPCNLRIICDAEDALRGLAPSPNISILRHCYGSEFLLQMAGADLVVLPLKENDISSGQMVLLHAMALGKPVVITRTPTTEEYGEHLQTVYFVERGSMEDLAQGILRIQRDPELAAFLGQRARERFNERHSMPAFVRALLGTIEKELSGETRHRPGREGDVGAA